MFPELSAHQNQHVGMEAGEPVRWGVTARSHSLISFSARPHGDASLCKHAFSIVLSNRPNGSCKHKFLKPGLKVKKHSNFITQVPYLGVIARDL